MWDKIKNLVAGAGDALGVEIPTDLGAVTDGASQLLGGSGVSDAVSGVTEAAGQIADVPAVAAVTDVIAAKGEPAA
jgi:hypothetical protein